VTHSPLRFKFEKPGELSGRYLLKEFDVAFTLLGEQYLRRELFALDTGSPMTLLRWKAFDPPGGALQHDPNVELVEVRSWDRTSYVHSIPDVCLSADGFSFVLPSAKIDRNLNNHDFSLLGTDFLEHFYISFDPSQGFALLLPKEIRTADEIDDQYVDAVLYGAVEILCYEDKKLLELDVGERTITQHLAKHLQRFFPGWDVDCEYNRLGDVPEAVAKRIPEMRPDNSVGTSNPGERTVLPDIIVHRRGDAQENLLIIELKKADRPRIEDDKEKLHLYVKELGYQHAYFISVPTGKQASFEECKVERISP